MTVLLVYAFSQVDRSKREAFIEHIHKNFEPMTATGQSIYDSLIEEGMEKGIEKGIEKNARMMVRNMRDNGMTVEKIAKFTGLETEEVQRLLAEPSDD